jgi:RNA polymerase sigma-70 factor, ECF subfamily
VNCFSAWDETIARRHRSNDDDGRAGAAPLRWIRRRNTRSSSAAELVDAHKDLVHAMVWRLARDRSQLEDLAQDVFLNVHRGLPYFRGEARLSTWIYRIVMNVCSQSKPRAPGVVSLDDDRGGRRIELQRDDAAFAEMELRDRLEKAIAKLPEQYRVLVAAHHLQGIQYEALAEALGIPLGTVKTHLHRAKRRLRELLEGES